MPDGMVLFNLLLSRVSIFLVERCVMIFLGNMNSNKVTLFSTYFE